MFKNIIVLCTAGLLLAGCSTGYTPSEYPLRPGLIPAFDVAGSVQISNAQPSTATTLVYSYMGTTMSSDLKSITDVMVQQTNEELKKNGHPTGAASSKSIALKVNSLKSEYIAFYWTSEIQFQAMLGDGQTIDFTVNHTSGNPLQDLNGCIAEGVMHLLTDARIKAYLAG